MFNSLTYRKLIAPTLYLIRGCRQLIIVTGGILTLILIGGGEEIGIGIGITGNGIGIIIGTLGPTTTYTTNE